MKKILSFMLVAVLALAMVMAGCSNNNSNNNQGQNQEKQSINVYNWGEYIDTDVLKDFEEETGIKVNYTNYANNEEMYAKIKGGGADYDVIIPSDYMISRMINEDMLEKLDLSKIPNFSKLNPSFINNDFDPNNEYSVAYAWGTVGIIYNKTMVDEPVDSWDILWNEKYKGQILMFDNSRDAIGIALKKLGYSMNTTDKAELDAAYNELVKQKPPLLQAYVMDQIFDKMESSEAALGVYYAGDYLTMAENNSDLAFCLPKEGSNVFIDSICIPKGAKNIDGAHKFIDYMTSTEASLKNLEVTGYGTPQMEAFEQLDKDVKNDQVTYPSDELLANCESFINLPDDILEYYDTLWARLKS